MPALLNRLSLAALVLIQVACVSTNTLEGRLEEGATFYALFATPSDGSQQSSDFSDQLEEELMGLFDIAKMKSISKPGSFSIEVTYRSPEAFQNAQGSLQGIMAKFEAENPGLTRER